MNPIGGLAKERFSVMHLCNIVYYFTCDVLMASAVNGIKYFQLKKEDRMEP